MIQISDVIRDRGSRYAVAGGVVEDRAGVEHFLKTLKADKKIAKATHNSWAVVLTGDGPVKNDDGEAGAGAVILRMLEREGLTDCVIVVTRWYGGVHLGGDRFAHVVTCVRRFLEAWQGDGTGKGRRDA
jgi:putative IMPACT (imprinted ancient) family translation regulator